MDPKWYLKRLASMSPAEVAGRMQDAGRRRAWKHRPPQRPARAASPARTHPITPDGLVSRVSETSAWALLAEADELLAGRWTMFGRPRTDMTDSVDYHLDFVNGIRSPSDGFSFDINHRHEDEVGNIKFVWEPARHHHLTLLAAAYAVSGEAPYAERVEAELRNYWRATPFLTGIHWTSGIEIGLRLIAWTWIRRLLNGWDRAPALFEDDPTFVDQLGRHHQWLASLGSHGSSANNHVIAEACGQFIAASAFPLFAESETWREQAAEELARELDLQTFPDGLNRELASDYHGFVLEMVVAAWVEAVLTGHPLADRLADPIVRAFDALHIVVDATGRPHRQGDSDDAHGLLLDPIGYDRWRSLLRTASVVCKPAPWWWTPDPGVSDVRTAVLAGCVASVTSDLDGGASGSTGRSLDGIRADTGARPTTRPARLADAGLTVLRDLESGPGRAGPAGGSNGGLDGAPDELWCMIDHGPHGFLSTAAHAHADALAVEIRSGGVEIVADPGTYCYHGEKEWRDHFRSTAAHATVTVDSTDQSEMAGPFLWTHKAEAHLESASGLEAGPVAACAAVHDGYAPIGVLHRRTVSLDRTDRTIEIVDRLDPAPTNPASTNTGTGSDADDGTSDGGPRPHEVAVTYPLGPDVTVDLRLFSGATASNADGPHAVLTWPRGDGAGTGNATVTLDERLSWRVVSGGVSPPEGWYSAHFGTKQPSSTLVGHTSAAEIGGEFRTLFSFISDVERSSRETPTDGPKP